MAAVRSSILAVLVSVLFLPALAGLALADSRYRAYSSSLLRSLPKDARVRPDLEAYLNQLATQFRRKAGRTALKPSNRLTGAARGQAAEMVLGNFVGHQSRGGYRFAARFAAFAEKNYRGLRGENAARDRQSGPADRRKARRLFQQWLDSAGHRKNLMTADYRYVSTGVIQKGNHLYAIQIFWEPNRDSGNANQLVIE